MALNYNYKYVLYESTNIYEPYCILHYSIRWERIIICRKIEINLHDTQLAATHYKSLLKNEYTGHNIIFSLHCYSVDAKITLQKTYFQILNKVDLIPVCNQRCFNLDITALTHRKVYVQTLPKNFKYFKYKCIGFLHVIVQITVSILFNIHNSIADFYASVENYKLQNCAKRKNISNVHSIALSIIFST